MSWNPVGKFSSTPKRGSLIQSSLHGILVIALLLSVMAAAVDARPAKAALAWTVTQTTWNVMGLDSNNVNVGPDTYPVGVRFCNDSTAGETITNISALFVWDSANTYINLRTGSLNPVTVSSLAAGSCAEIFFDVTITRTGLAYDTSRQFHIEITADPGISWNSTTQYPNREIYVEHLVSQNRNDTYEIWLYDASMTPPGTLIPPGGNMLLQPGVTYYIKLVAKTATNGYEQIETFLNFPNNIFRINSIATTYTFNDSTDPEGDELISVYADSCNWVNDYTDIVTPTYRECTTTGKAGGDVTMIYNVTVISPTVFNAPMVATIYDFSGSSYHYNADYQTYIPVTVSYFTSERQGEQVAFNWSTATETGNVGFNLYAQETTLVKLNDQLIASIGSDSINPQDYSFTAQTGASVFYIEDVDLFGKTRRHGPFALGEEFGTQIAEQPVDWAAVDAGLQADLVKAAGTAGALDMQVRQTGMYRVTYEALSGAGLDLNGVNPANILVTLRGNTVPIYVLTANGKFGPGSYIEFYGRALNTLYTDTNIYQIRKSAKGSPSIAIDTTPAGINLPAVKTYAEKLVVNNQKEFAFYAPGKDPWYDTSMLVFLAPKVWDYKFTVKDMVPDAAGVLNLVVWGSTDWPQAGDHHLKVSVNGAELEDVTFDGIVEQVLPISIPAENLQEGENTLTLTLPGDTGVAYESVTLDKFSVSYPRLLKAELGQLTFTAAGNVFRVVNLDTPNVVVYKLVNNKPVRVGKVAVRARADNTYTATFAGSAAATTYLVSTVEALNAPVLANRPAKANLGTPAEYLIISHPNFMGGLDSLVQAREAQGLTVNVVNVNDLYAKYTFGIFDPAAIKTYIKYAAQNLGTQYVLLVGGDTYDYRNYTGLNSVSFIPSLYAATSPLTRYVAVDPLYADTTGDNIPDLAIGRFPVRTVDELAMIVNKTLAYQTKTYEKTSVFAADKIDVSLSFKNMSAGMAALMPASWGVQQINLDDYALVATAKADLLAAMNQGTALVTYTGHSGPDSWTFSPFFTKNDAAALTNAGKPFVAVQYGCWNTYYVDPKNNHLVQSILFSGDKGAAAVMGAVTITDTLAEDMLAILLTPKLVEPGMTMGQAIVDAKQALALTHPEVLDVMLGWTLMGDPALVVQP